MGKIIFTRLFDLLDERHLPKSYLKSSGIIGGQTYNNLISNGNISTITLTAICDHLQCQPDDIMEYVADNK